MERNTVTELIKTNQLDKLCELALTSSKDFYSEYFDFSILGLSVCQLIRFFKVFAVYLFYMSNYKKDNLRSFKIISFGSHCYTNQAIILFILSVI